ncbi:MAG: EamA family transporter [Archaeoglobales archaeon]|nr:EamA family transporter [Archaeoglobales archaeon]
MRGEVALVLAAILMSTLSIFVRSINADPLSIVFLRLSTASFILLAAIFLLRKPFKPTKIMFLLGLLNLATISCYVSALKGIEVATAAMLLYMAAVYVIPIAILSGEKVDLQGYLALILGLSGLYLMLSPYPEMNAVIVLGLFSGVFYALVFHFTKKARNLHDSLEISAFNTAFGALVLLPYFLTHPANADAFLIIGLGTIPTALPFTLFAYGMKYVKTSRAPIISLIEPLSASLLGFFYFGEVLTDRQILGAFLILSSIFIATKTKNI